MDFKKISDDIQGCEGILIGDYGERTLYVREDEVMRLILKYAYNIDYVKPEENVEDFDEDES
jgi:hypothetical protein